MERNNIAGISLKGGRRDQFYFCLLEYYANDKRWFLKSLLKVKDDQKPDGNDVINGWIDKFNPQYLIVDSPLSSPACQSCNLKCPGSSFCSDPKVKEVREKMENLLMDDAKLRMSQPKRYERERNSDDEINFSKDILSKEPFEHILSRPFKRRLKKGYLPYWNRQIDFWIWLNYYDQLLNFYNISYDSFGSTSLMLLSRFSYLKRHFSNDLVLLEGNILLTLIELLRAKICLKKDILNFSAIEQGVESRLDIIKNIEKKLNIFIYDHELEILVKNPRAFESFILSLSGRNLFTKEVRQIPSWANDGKTNFVVPIFG